MRYKLLDKNGLKEFVKFNPTNKVIVEGNDITISQI
jgi:hypothetical protein